MVRSSTLKVVVFIFGILGGLMTSNRSIDEPDVESLTKITVRQPWNLTGVIERDAAGKVCETAMSEEMFHDEALRLLCKTEAEDFIPASYKKPLVAMIDTSRLSGNKSGRYYIDRDGAMWSRIFQRIGFDVAIYSRPSRKSPGPSISRWNVLLCLGLLRLDENCLSPSNHRNMRRQQRINMFNGIRTILWKKDAFCDTLQSSLAGYNGIKDFYIPCFILPRDESTLQQTMQESRQKWIVKPTDRGEGHGIFMAESMEEIKREIDIDSTRCIVQPYVETALIDGYKFDLRTYVLVTSVSPVRIYMHDEGLVRFAAEKYEAGKKRKTQFLTNTSVGKSVKDISELTWTFHQLKLWLEKHSISSSVIFDRIYEVVARVILSAEGKFRDHFNRKMHGNPCEGCYQLLGVDVMIDRDWKPKIIEVNGLPSMQLSEPVSFDNPYTARKLNLTYDLTKMLYMPTSTAPTVHNRLSQLRLGIGPGPSCDSSRGMIGCVAKKDLHHVIRMEREYQNRGAFHRLYPHPNKTRFGDLVHHIQSTKGDSEGYYGIMSGDIHALTSSLAVLQEQGEATIG